MLFSPLEKVNNLENELFMYIVQASYTGEYNPTPTPLLREENSRKKGKEKKKKIEDGKRGEKRGKGKKIF